MRFYEIRLLVDVRSIPYSRYNPQFNLEQLAQHFGSNGALAYRHDSNLAGPRPEADILAQARTCSERSRGYYHHTKTEVYTKALTELFGDSANRPIAIMCGQLYPEHCHRIQIADSLYQRGAETIHIIDRRTSYHHQPNLFT